MFARERDAVQADGLSGKDRFEIWREVIGRTRVCDATSAHEDDFTAEARHFDLGEVVLLGGSFSAVRFRRTERMIRRSDEELYHLTLLTSGHNALRRGRDQVEVFGPGDLQITDSSHPYDAPHFAAPDSGTGQIGGVGIDLPVSMLPLPPRQVRDLLGRPFSGRDGTGAVLADFLLSLERRAPSLRPAEASRLGTAAVDLVAVWLARELDAVSTLCPEVRQRALVDSIRGFIRANLHDPELAPPVVAAAHHISVSHLHRLFARHSHGETVAACIRRQRLGKAHRELADPTLLALPVHAIGARCGIPNPSEFGRAFKAAHGLSPREHRRRAQPDLADEQDAEHGTGDVERGSPPAAGAGFVGGGTRPTGS